MGSYITLSKKLPKNPKLHNAAEKLAKRVRIEIDGQPLSEEQICHALGHALLGVTVTLWSRADEQVSRDNTLPWSVTGVLREIGCHAAIFEALPEDWLRIRDSGAVELPGYVERNSLIPLDERKESRDKKRVQNRVRQQRRRAKLKGVSRTVTRDIPASRAVTRDSHAGHAPTGTDTGNQDRLVEERDVSGASVGESANAGTRPARQERRPKSKPEKSRDVLRRDARELSRNGNSIEEIVRILRQYDVTPAEVREWIGESEGGTP